MARTSWGEEIMEFKVLDRVAPETFSEGL